MTAAEVVAARGRVQASVDGLWDWVHADALRGAA